ncbi:universal stress protein [Bdellovibrionota bacterium FG-2]
MSTSRTIDKTISAEPRRIVWAIDPFGDTETSHQLDIEFLRHYSQKQPIAIEPVYVLSPSEINLSAELSAPVLAEAYRFRPAAEKALEKALSGVQIPGLLPPKILVQYLASLTHTSQVLSEYAGSTGAHLILANTHGRSGLKRAFLGSFAESLLNHAHTPIVIVGPGVQSMRPLDQVLFPTDFREASRKTRCVFRKLIDFASELHSSVTIYHSISHTLESAMQSGASLLGGGWIPIQATFSDEAERKQRRAELWSEWAKNKGVPSDALIDVQFTSMPEAILQAAKQKNVGLIAMEPQSGPLVSALVGSTLRQVIRHADCPVWVYRPDEAELKSATTPLIQDKAA